MRTTSTQAKAARIKAEGALATAEAVDDVAEVKMEELSGILLRKPRCGVMRRCKRGTGEIGAGPVFQEYVVGLPLSAFGHALCGSESGSRAYSRIVVQAPGRRSRVP